MNHLHPLTVIFLGACACNVLTVLHVLLDTLGAIGRCLIWLPMMAFVVSGTPRGTHTCCATALILKGSRAALEVP